MDDDNRATLDNFGKRCEQAEAVYQETNLAEKMREAARREAFNHPPFTPHTPESLRAAANAMRKRNGLGPLPEPV